MSTYSFVGEDRPDGWSVSVRESEIEAQIEHRLKLKAKIKFKLEYFQLMMMAGRDKEAVETFREIYDLVEKI
jgi:hypothetical protein